MKGNPLHCHHLSNATAWLQNIPSVSALATALVLPLVLISGCGGSGKAAEAQDTTPAADSDEAMVESEGMDTGGWKPWLAQACECESTDPTVESVKNCMSKNAVESEEIGDTIESLIASSSVAEQREWVRKALLDHQLEGCAYLTELQFLGGE